MHEHADRDHSEPTILDPDVGEMGGARAEIPLHGKPATQDAGQDVPVVVDFPTIMDGYVVRWYASEHAANHYDPVISASRERVSVHDPGPLADSLLEQAGEVHQQIADSYRMGGRGARAWASVLTHKARLFGDVELLAGAVEGGSRG